MARWDHHQKQTEAERLQHQRDYNRTRPRAVSPVRKPKSKPELKPQPVAVVPTEPEIPLGHAWQIRMPYHSRPEPVKMQATDREPLEVCAISVRLAFLRVRSLSHRPDFVLLI
jgi:hypothetical protein